MTAPVSVPEFVPRLRVFVTMAVGALLGLALLTSVTTPQHFSGQVTRVTDRIDGLVVTDFPPSVGQTWITDGGVRWELVGAYRQEDLRYVVSLRPIDGDVEASSFAGDAPLVGTAGMTSVWTSVVEGVVR